MDTADALAALRTLTPDAIRARLDELEAEAQSLRTLLRATLARERIAQRSAPDRPRSGGRHAE